MIDIFFLDKTFKQTFGSCVLASYAIAANYFTGIPVGLFFDAYCRHFGISKFGESAEETYSKHFDSLINTSGQNGYQVILNLHEYSMVPEFEKARLEFSFEFFSEAFPVMTSLESKLREETALLNLTIGSFVISGSIMAPIQRLNCHSFTVFHDGDFFFIRDTNKEPGENIIRLTSLFSLKQTRDAVIYKKKRPLAG